MSTEQFLPVGYEAPTSGGYARIEAGTNKFRILSSPLMVWTIWGGGKSTRIPYNKDQKPALPDAENPSVKHAWIMVVWNYQTEKIEILELDKMTLINPLLAHATSPDWGNPRNYDVNFTKTGSGQQGTKYAFTAVPPKAADPAILAAAAETPIDLNQMLIDGGNPFLSASAAVATQTAPISSPALAPQAPVVPPISGADNPFPPQTPTKAF